MVNRPNLRAKPKNKVCLRCHKSLATCCISHVISSARNESLTVTVIKLAKKRAKKTCSSLSLSLSFLSQHEWLAST